MPKATKTTPGRPGTSSRSRAVTKPASAERNAAKVVESARDEATRVRAEAEAHALRLVLDARATADGVRAEGMEVVSSLRQISDTLRELSDRVLEDVEAIHARMVGELEAVRPEGGAPAESDPRPAATPVEADEPLDVPDFVARD